MLARDFGTDDVAVDAAVVRLTSAGGARAAGPEAQRVLREALTPRHKQLLRVLTGLAGGVKSLVDLRAAVLASFP